MILVIVFVKVFVMWNINDFYFYRYEWIFVMIRRYINEVIEFFFFISVFGFFKEDFVEFLFFVFKYNWLRFIVGFK